MVTIENVQEALSNVIDPELGLDFVELGLIYDIAIEGGDVQVTFTLTAPGCPIGPEISSQIEEFVAELDGVESVTSTMVFTPPWTPERMSEDAKFALGYLFMDDDKDWRLRVDVADAPALHAHLRGARHLESEVKP